jgi:uncharacterized phage-associated protein
LEAAEMNIAGRFKPEKALEVLLYVVRECPDMYTALKLLYFADKEHLSRYGRIISSDHYVAMSHGPVPSGTYDLVKYVRNNSSYLLTIPLDKAFKVEDNNIIPLRDPNLEMLSSSEIECLDSAIARYASMSFGQLRRLSHSDPAFKAADENDFIPLEAFVKSVPDGERLWAYLTSD